MVPSWASSSPALQERLVPLCEKLGHLRSVTGTTVLSRPNSLAKGLPCTKPAVGFRRGHPPSWDLRTPLCFVTLCPHSFPALGHQQPLFHRAPRSGQRRVEPGEPSQSLVLCCARLRRRAPQGRQRGWQHTEGQGGHAAGGHTGPAAAELAVRTASPAATPDHPTQPAQHTDRAETQPGRRNQSNVSAGEEKHQIRCARSSVSPICWPGPQHTPPAARPGLLRARRCLCANTAMNSPLFHDHDTSLR